MFAFIAVGVSHCLEVESNPEGAGQCGGSGELCWEGHGGSASQITVFAEHLVAKVCLVLHCH